MEPERSQRQGHRLASRGARRSLVAVVLAPFGFAVVASLVLVSQRETVAQAADSVRMMQAGRSASQGQTIVYLRRCTGDLRIGAVGSTDVFQAYVHIPIPFGDQAPILLTVTSPQLVDYRYVRLSPPNVLVAARMRSQNDAVLHWEAWVLVRENSYEGLPKDVLIPSADQLPEDVGKWLAPTDCAQIDDPFIQNEAANVRGSTTEVVALADAVAARCYAIPWEFSHNPIALDAYYALKWGGSCTSLAHAGAALMRASGVPARSLMVMPAWFEGAFDMHWIIDYYVPTYGWVRMETSGGMNPVGPEDEIVVMVCNPEDEFPLFFPMGIEGYWHTSDPVLGVTCPNWGQAHRALREGQLATTTEEAERAMKAAVDAFDREVSCWGTILTHDQHALVEEARGEQVQAVRSFVSGDFGGFLAAMEKAAGVYGLVRLGRQRTIFMESFESGGQGWTHGGTRDTWTLDQPRSKPPTAHSGSFCFGTGFSGAYENRTDSWLLSPPFSLKDEGAAQLSFWLYNWVEDNGGYQGVIRDPLWVEVTSDGQTFLPLCSSMGGVNDDPAIPSVGGWARMVLDLAPYLGGESVQIRFRFASNASRTAPGSFIDDVEVAGRHYGEPVGCAASGTPTTGASPLAVDFTASAFGGGPPYTFSWSFGDGEASGQQNPAHVYLLPATYVAAVTVTDSRSEAASCSVPISVVAHTIRRRLR